VKLLWQNYSVLERAFGKLQKHQSAEPIPLSKVEPRTFWIWNRHDKLSIAVLWASTDSTWIALVLNPSLMTRSQYLSVSTLYWMLRNFSNWYSDIQEFVTRHLNCVFLNSDRAFLLRCLTQTCSFHSKWNPSRNDQLNTIYRVIKKDVLNWRVNGASTHARQVVAVFQVLCSLYGLICVDYSQNSLEFVSPSPLIHVVSRSFCLYTHSLFAQIGDSYDKCSSSLEVECWNEDETHAVQH